MDSVLSVVDDLVDFICEEEMSGIANLHSLGYACPWEWLGPGGLPGLQNLWRVALRVAVGSTPIHSRFYQYRQA